MVAEIKNRMGLVILVLFDNKFSVKINVSNFVK